MAKCSDLDCFGCKVLNNNLDYAIQGLSNGSTVIHHRTDLGGVRQIEQI